MFLHFFSMIWGKPPILLYGTTIEKAAMPLMSFRSRNVYRPWWCWIEWENARVIAQIIAHCFACRRSWVWSLSWSKLYFSIENFCFDLKLTGDEKALATQVNHLVYYHVHISRLNINHHLTFYTFHELLSWNIISLTVEECIFSYCHLVYEIR